MSEPSTDADLLRLAVDWVEGKIFSTADFDGEEMPPHMIFMPLAFTPNDILQRWISDEANAPYFIYEYLQEAGPRSVNGYPQFISHWSTAQGAKGSCPVKPKSKC